MKTLRKLEIRDFPGVSVVKNLPSNAGYVGLIPCWGTEIPHATGQLSQHTAAKESPHATKKSQHSQNTKKKKIRNKWNFLNLIEHLQKTYS